jgi:hypothetical protein
MRTIKTYFKGAPFYNAFLRPYPINTVLYQTKRCINIPIPVINQRTMWRALKLMAVGAVSFWLPDILWQAIRAYKFSGVDVLGITFLMPLTMLVSFLLIRKRQRHESDTSAVWPLMVVGVWLLGGFFITVGASFSGGGFVRPGIPQTFAMSLIPGIAFLMATYDGSLAALLIVSIIPLLIWLTKGIKQSLKARLVHRD